MTTSPPYLIYSANGANLWMLPAPVFKGDVYGTIDSLAGFQMKHLASLIEPDEAEALGLAQLHEATNLHRIHLHVLPIVDRHPPNEPQDFNALAGRLTKSFLSGESVGVHCKSGIGRSGMITCAILGKLGFDLNQALARIAKHRGLEAPNTPRQIEWLEGFWGTLAAA